MSEGPGAFARDEGDAPAEEELAQAMTSADEVFTQVLARWGEVSGCFVLLGERVDLGEQSGAEQQGELLGVTAIGLDALAGLAWDERGSHEHEAGLAPGGDLALQGIAAGPGFVAVAHVPRGEAGDALEHLADGLSLVGDPPLDWGVVAREKRRHVDPRLVDVETDKSGTLHRRLLSYAALAFRLPTRGLRRLEAVGVACDNSDFTTGAGTSRFPRSSVSAYPLHAASFQRGVP